MLRLPLLSIVMVVTLVVPLRAQTWPGRERIEPERCGPVAGDRSAADWLDLAAAVTGMAANGTRRLTWRGSETEFQAYQSDRPYPPYLASARQRVWQFDPGAGIERWQAPAGGPVFLLSDRALYMMRDSLVVPVPQAWQYSQVSRGLDPLAVLFDFRHAESTVREECTFRGFPRMVLEHDGDRLYLDAKSGLPVKYERVEPNSTWGQVLAEYVYTTWWEGDGVALPITAVRHIDGVPQLRRDLALPQSAGDRVVGPIQDPPPPTMTVPPADHRQQTDVFRTPNPVDTARIGANTWLLTSRYYTHAVTLQRDTVFLFDATMADWRSRADSAWIATLFPGTHPVTLVVTDLAWPHVGGVRFWAARGARIVTHRISVPFITQLLERRWTLQPDTYEAARARVTPRVVGIDESMSLAGGAIRLAPIDGGATEGALLGWIAPTRFLWAGDYIQQVDAASLYARDVLAAARREGLVPERVAAQHLPVTPWTAVERANPPR